MLVLGSLLTLAFQLPSFGYPSAARRAPGCVALGDTDAQDFLIAKLRTAPPGKLASVLADSMKSVDQRLFLRMAELADAAADGDERDNIVLLASDVAKTVRACVLPWRPLVPHHPKRTRR